MRLTMSCLFFFYCKIWLIKKLAYSSFARNKEINSRFGRCCILHWCVFHWVSGLERVSRWQRVGFSVVFILFLYILFVKEKDKTKEDEGKSFANLYLKRLEISRETKRLPKVLKDDVRKEEAMALDPFLLYFFISYL